MRWEDERESSNVEDVRGDSGGGFGGGGFGGGGLLGLLPLLLGAGRGGIVVLVIIVALVFGGQFLRGGGGSSAPPQASAPSSGFQGQPQAAGSSTPDVDLRFVKKVVALTEDTWTEIFKEQSRSYPPPKVKVYSRAYPTGCGPGRSEMGPFYCPVDRTVYLDLDFFQELSGRFGAPGRFAEAYVIAHEVGHHVQNLLGQMDQNGPRNASGGSRNQTSVRTELQADCYAGVWANRTNRDRNFLDPGDIDEGLKAASAVGDDTLQREATGRVAPDSFTHGTSAQRVKWFRAGYDSGSMGACDTFSGAYGSL